MTDEIGELRLKILSLRDAIRKARSDTAREYARVILKELETYLEVLETRQPEPIATKPPE
jgi:hypothetical protein